MRRKIWRAKWQSISILTLCLVFALTTITYAQTPGPWDNVATEGAIVAGSDIVPVSTLPRYDGPAELNCVKKKIPTRKGSTVASRMKDGCWYSTKWGLLEQGGTYLVPKGYDIAGSIYVDPNRYDGRRYGFHPTSNPDVLRHSFAVANGMSIYRRGDSVRFVASLGSNGSLGISTDFSGATSTNTSVSKLASNGYFSDNGRWAVHVHKGSVTRYDMDTMNSVSFAGATVVSLPAFPYADINDSGRYILYSLDNSQDAFKVIDLDACTIPTDARDVSISGCTGVDLRPRVVSVLGYTPAGYGSVRFVGDSIIQGWAEHPETGQWRTFHVYAASVNPDAQKYLALGDSIASGEGAYHYVEGTDVDENKCHLSTSSYPYLFGMADAAGEVHSLACSGAKMENIRKNGYRQQENEQDDNQTGSYQWLPGRVSQLDNRPSTLVNGFEFVPTVVTVSVGGNDIRFADKLTQCVLPQNLQTCFNTYGKRLSIAKEIISKHDELVRLYDEIQDTSAPNARVYAIGYPQIVESAPGASCSPNVLFNDVERAMAYDLVTFFNAVIKHAAATAGVQFVGVEGAFGTHKLCGESTKAVNGFMRGNDDGIGSDTFKIKFVGKESFHPNAFGHKLLYERIKSQTNNLTSWEVESPDAMPDPANYPFLANMETTDEAVASAKNVRYLPSEDTVAQRGNPLRLNLSDMTLGIKPNTLYRVELHSDPVEIGTITSNGLGEIIGDIALPVDIEPGLHSMHIFGSNESGEVIDVYEHLYIAAAENDFDGDGVLNTDEPCGIIEPSEIDYDQDGIDDACDAEISEPPESGPEPNPTPESTPENPAAPAGIIVKVFAFLEEVISYTRPKIENIINQYVSSIKKLVSWPR